MPACFVVMCVYNDAFRSLCPGRASVESSMSSVKGFSGPASEKIKLFFIGHRRRDFYRPGTLAGTALRTAFSDAWLCLPEAVGPLRLLRVTAARSVLQRTTAHNKCVRQAICLPALLAPCFMSACPLWLVCYIPLARLRRAARADETREAKRRGTIFNFYIRATSDAIAACRDLAEDTPQ